MQQHKMLVANHRQHNGAGDDNQHHMSCCTTSSGQSAMTRSGSSSSTRHYNPSSHYLLASFVNLITTHKAGVPCLQKAWEPVVLQAPPKAMHRVRLLYTMVSHGNQGQTDIVRVERSLQSYVESGRITPYHHSNTLLP